MFKLGIQVFFSIMYIDNLLINVDSQSSGSILLILSPAKRIIAHMKIYLKIISIKIPNLPIYLKSI